MKTNTLLLGAIMLILAINLFQTHEMKVDLDMSEQNNNTISVIGKAERNVVPDTASISFYVTKKSQDQTEAANYVNKKTKDIIATLVDMNIEKKDIKTTNYSLNPQYNWNDGKQRFDGYRAQQNVTVIIRELTNTQDILARIVEHKVDNLNGPNMYIDNLDEVKSSLRSEAITDAKAKAKELARELDVELDKIVSFSEGNNIDNYNPRMAKMGLAESVSFDSVAIPEITPGEEKIIKTVTLVFKIEN